MNKKIITLLYSVLIASIASPFIQTTSFNNSTSLYICIFTSVLIAFFAKNKTLPILWIATSSVFIMFIYTNQLSLEFNSWFSYFINDITIKLKSFLNRDILLIPQEIGLLVTYLIITLSITFIANSKGVWKVYLVSYIVFYMLLSVFLKIQFFESILVAIGVGLLIGFIENSPTSISSFSTKKILIIGILLSLLIAGSNYVNFYRSIHLYLIKNTMDLRSTLSYTNFYDYFRLSERSTTSSKSGYSNDDSRLGGPLYMDYSEVFSVKETQQTYWRVNSKYRYNGKGWVDGQTANENSSMTLPSQVGKPTLNNQKPVVHEILKVDKSVYYIPIPLGYSEYQIDTDVSHTIFSDSSLGFYDINAIILNDVNNNLLNGSSYITSPPVSSKDILEDIEPSIKTLEYIKKQAINNIPDKVKELALEVTSEGDSMYQKVKLIETYLNSNQQLKYSLSDVPYVPEGGNFVEHFLFESQIGYCEHFASTMVVMAQSLGFPARYAKGFSKGSNFDGITTIKNSDAHAWPEIYFEEYGWVAFEPTPSFSLPLSLESEGSGDSEKPGNLEVVLEAPSNEQDNVQLNPSTPQEIQKIEENDTLTITLLWISGLSLLLILFFIYILRFKLLIIYTKFVLKHKVKNFTQAFEKLLKVVNRLYPLDESEILTHYSMRLDESIRVSLLPLIKKYESIRYSNRSNISVTSDDIESMIQLLNVLWKRK